MDNLKLENLLKQISEIKKKNDALLDVTGMRFNIFKILGVNHYENRHSSILAELLNPKGTHGMKDTFLKLFIKIVLADDFSFDLENKNITVRKEYTIDDGRIDILIYNSEQAIIIENKISAHDQEDQLKRYASFGEKKYNGNYRILYLTLWGNKATEQSGGGINYKCISYKDHIIKWLEECLKVSSNSPNVNQTIFQYLNHLKQLTYQDMDTEYTNRIVDLLADNVENVESAVIIYQNFEKMKLKIIEEMGNRIAEKIPKKFSDEWLFVDDNYMNGFHFAKKKEEWPKKAGIYFAENNKQLYFAFKNQAACTGEAEPQEKITELFDMDPIPYDPYGYKLVGPHWNYNPEILINIKDGKYEEEFVIPYLVHALEYLENHPDVEKNMCS